MEKIEKKRLDALRRVMAQQGIDCCIINSTDPHQSEIPAAHWRGREWMTGFKSENGTNGIAVVTKDRAYVWTDNRFFIQARQQLEGTGFEMMPLDGPEGVDLVEYIADMMPEDSVVAIDGMTFSSTDAEKMREAFEEAGLHFATDFPMFDYIWPDRPEQPLNRLFIHDEDIVGETVESKISRILTEVDKEGADAILISALDDIAWATNLRAAGDVVFSPMFLAYLYLDKEGSRILFINEKKLTEEVREFLKKYDIEIRGYDEVTRFAETLSPSSCVLIDPSLTSITIAEAIPTAIEGGKGVAKLKSVKNETMLAHWRTAMEKDGVALVKLFKWIDEEFPAGKLTEMSIARKLRECRLADPDCVDESFAAIVGWNSHGAIVHYEPSDETDVPVTGQGLLLIDSGGQYTHGTTDITRTVALGGEPTAEQKHDFTLVLKGMIALATATFPKGTRGAQLDILARRYLWNEGKAYYHGTGHGVGFFINCHEGPAQIRMNDIPVPLEPGMVMSDEPGLYIEGKYGIRCENMLAVEHWKNNEFGEFYRFRNLTLFPFDRNLIEWEIITPEEKRWLESYNKEIIERLSPLLDADEKKWLESKING
ncbi:MAG: aminopeptidase P family protein [Muribaculaceae bacterium]|nr:aminopeptidase P family protein [Muribaculaceae bacterium]